MKLAPLDAASLQRLLRNAFHVALRDEGRTAFLIAFDQSSDSANPNSCGSSSVIRALSTSTVWSLRRQPAVAANPASDAFHATRTVRYLAKEL